MSMSWQLPSLTAVGQPQSRRRPRHRGRSELEGGVQARARARLGTAGVVSSRHGRRDRFDLGPRRTARHRNGDVSIAPVAGSGRLLVHERDTPAPRRGRDRIGEQASRQLDERVCRGITRGWGRRGTLIVVARTVYVVCTRDAYWPPEALVVFGTEDAARRHVDGALWSLRVEPLPVYETYEECPPENCGLGPGMSGLAEQALRRLGIVPPRGRVDNVPIREIANGSLGTNGGGFFRFEDRDQRESSVPVDEVVHEPWGSVGGVVHGVRAGDQDGGGLPFNEVELFYETEQAAQEHVAGCYYMASVLPFMVYGRYEDCPPNLRFDSRSGAKPHSQGMNLKRGPRLSSRE
jgi:hypothetical protein